MLLQHDIADPVGVWLEMSEDSRGLYVVGRLAVESRAVRDVMALLEAGALDGLSIGFKPVRASQDRRTGRRRLIEVDLWEVSIVTFPMQPMARLTLSSVGGRSSSAASPRYPPRATPKPSVRPAPLPRSATAWK